MPWFVKSSHNKSQQLGRPDHVTAICGMNSHPIAKQITRQRMVRNPSFDLIIAHILTMNDGERTRNRIKSTVSADVTFT